MSTVRVLTKGVGQDGLIWKLTVGGDDDNYTTILETRNTTGIIDCGGMGGPKLWNNLKLNVYMGRNPARGPLAVVVRCEPSITRVVAIVAIGGDIELAPCGEDIVDGLRFAVGLFPGDTKVAKIVGYGSGVVLESFRRRG
jgi:hypothetical protein